MRRRQSPRSKYPILLIPCGMGCPQLGEPQRQHLMSVRRTRKVACGQQQPVRFASAPPVWPAITRPWPPGLGCGAFFGSLRAETKYHMTRVNAGWRARRTATHRPQGLGFASCARGNLDTTWLGRGCTQMHNTAKYHAPMATKSSFTFVAVLADVSMKKMPLSLAYDSASCNKDGDGGSDG